MARKPAGHSIQTQSPRQRVQHDQDQAEREQREDPGDAEGLRIEVGGGAFPLSALARTWATMASMSAGVAWS